MDIALSLKEPPLYKGALALIMGLSAALGFLLGEIEGLSRAQRGNAETDQEISELTCRLVHLQITQYAQLLARGGSLQAARIVMVLGRQLKRVKPGEQLVALPPNADGEQPIEDLV
jgi:hypothetical protein